MAKKSKKLMEIAEILDGHTIEEFEEINVTVMKELVEELSEISDPRDEAYVRHKLSDILMIVLFAVMSNANEWGEIESFGKKKEKWLRKFLTLEHG
ncbi:MAG: transposase family protein, partial [Treponema sp.]|nr:transposase family protein [Treponema sp.]